MLIRTLALFSVFLASMSAQEFVGERDFLTDYEVDVLRKNQQPKDRIAAYIKFASLRIELIDQLLAAEEAGRGARIHLHLEEYSRIIEAIDTVIDDALSRDLDMEGAFEGLVDLGIMSRKK